MTILGHDGCEACAPEIARLRAECRRLREDAAAWERRASNLLDTVERPASVPEGAPLALDTIEDARTIGGGET